MSNELYIAIIAASAALLGSLIGQLGIFINGRLEREHRRTVLLRTKYEELSILFLESLKYPMKLLQITAPAQFTECANPKELNQIHMLSLIYFPLLRTATGAYLEAYVTYYKVIGNLYDPRNNRLSGEQVLNNPEYENSRNAYFSARDNLQDQIESHSTRYASG